MLGNVSFSVWAAQGHLYLHTLRRYKLMIEMSIRVTSLVMYTSLLHGDIFIFIKKQETGPTQVRYSIIHQILHAFIYAYGLQIT